jgi:ECF sigma factor
MSDVNRILSAIAQGDPHAPEQLLPLVYDEPRKLAAEKMAQEMPGQTLQAARKAYGYMPGHGRFPYQNHWLTCRAAIGKGWRGSLEQEDHQRSAPGPRPGPPANRFERAALKAAGAQPGEKVCVCILLVGRAHVHYQATSLSSAPDKKDTHQESFAWKGALSIWSAASIVAFDLLFGRPQQRKHLDSAAADLSPFRLAFRSAQ